MFCPKCSQQQVSEEVRFCSRCGFPLSGVARLVEGGGALVETEEEDGRRLTKRQRGVRKGLLIMSGGVAFAVLAVLLTLMKEDFFVLMLPAALAFVVGLMRMLYAVLLEEDSARPAGKSLPAAKGKTPPALEGAGARGTQLPPASRGVSAADLATRRGKTSEMVAPSSVTENTTRLLEDERE